MISDINCYSSAEVSEPDQTNTGNRRYIAGVQEIYT